MPEGTNISLKIGADVVVRTLEARGVEYVFGIPGAKIDAVFNALVDSRIKTVVCRHEQNAAFIAGGIGRMTGKAGVALATSGPGVSNLVTGLATANAEGDPMVALGGAVATGESLKRIHQTMDSVSICRPVTKFSAAVSGPEAVAEVVNNAFRVAESGRPGAAFVSLPMDIMSAPAHARLLTPPTFSGFGPAAPEGLKEAARLITMAKNAGRAARPASQQARDHRCCARFPGSQQLGRGRHVPVCGRGQRSSAGKLWWPGGPVGEPAGRPVARCGRPGGNGRLRPGGVLAIAMEQDEPHDYPRGRQGGRSRHLLLPDGRADGRYRPDARGVDAPRRTRGQVGHGKAHSRRHHCRAPALRGPSPAEDGDSHPPHAAGRRAAGDPRTGHDALPRHGLIPSLVGPKSLQLPRPANPDQQRPADLGSGHALGYCCLACPAA